MDILEHLESSWTKNMMQGTYGTPVWVGGPMVRQYGWVDLWYTSMGGWTYGTPVWVGETEKPSKVNFRVSQFNMFFCYSWNAFVNFRLREEFHKI